MVSRKGTLLETNVEQLLHLSGFSPKLNKVYNGYEIDVFLIYKNLKIAFECKQYERSTLAIRNLIHQWESKNGELNFDKVVLVLVGCDISSKEYILAKKYGIIIWDEKKFISLLNKAIENKSENKDTILKELGIKTDDINDSEETLLDIEETEQQVIIKEALNKIQKRGSRGSAFVIFEERGTDFFVQCSFDDNGFLFDFPEPDSTATEIFNEKQFKDIIDLLKSLQFKISEHKKVDKFSILKHQKVVQLEEKEFSVDDDGICAQCGEDISFIAYLIDKIFREIFKSDEDYKIKVQLELRG